MAMLKSANNKFTKIDGNGSVILLGEAEPDLRQFLEMIVRCDGHSAELAQDGEEVLRYVRSGQALSVVVLDLVLPRMDGIETLREIRSLHPNLPVIVISSAFSEVAAELIADDATQMLSQPFSPDDLRKAIRLAFERSVEAHRSPGASMPSGRDVFLGTSLQMKQLQTTVRRVGASDAPVLIQGETGVGKEVVARQLHAFSSRASKPLLKLNCAALPSELVESELFGYERGAFTGAFQKKVGMFELADGGTILLDEIGDMEFKLQAKLLQVLQDLRFQRLGGRESIYVDVRVLAATHNNLEEAIAGGRFREDLYYRLNVINLYVPPLRERREEILPLVSLFVQKYGGKSEPSPRMTPALEQALVEHNWPGNIRELENIVRAWIVLGDAEAIARKLRVRTRATPATASGSPAAHSVSLPAPAPVTVNPQPPRELRLKTLDQVSQAKQKAEAEAILAALNSTQWNRRQAAELLRIDYKAFLYKLKKPCIREEILSMSSNGAGHKELRVVQPAATWAAGS